MYEEKGTYPPSAPPTAAPSEGRVKERAVQGGMVGAATAAAAVAGMSPGVAALALLAEEQCPTPQAEGGEALSVALHPLQFSVNGNPFVGCVVGNAGIFAARSA